MRSLFLLLPFLVVLAVCSCPRSSSAQNPDDGSYPDDGGGQSGGGQSGGGQSGGGQSGGGGQYPFTTGTGTFLDPWVEHHSAGFRIVWGESSASIDLPYVQDGFQCRTSECELDSVNYEEIVDPVSGATMLKNGTSLLTRKSKYDQCLQSSAPNCNANLVHDFSLKASRHALRTTSLGLPANGFQYAADVIVEEEAATSSISFFTFPSTVKSIQGAYVWSEKKNGVSTAGSSFVYDCQLQDNAGNSFSKIELHSRSQRSHYFGNRSMIVSNPDSDCVEVANAWSFVTCSDCWSVLGYGAY